MFFLCEKRLYIVKEPLTKNRTHQTWREKQICACASRQPLEDIIDRMPPSQRKRFYINGYSDDENGSEQSPGENPVA